MLSVISFPHKLFSFHYNNHFCKGSIPNLYVNLYGIRTQQFGLILRDNLMSVRLCRMYFTHKETVRNPLIMLKRLVQAFSNQLSAKILKQHKISVKQTNWRYWKPSRDYCSITCLITVKVVKIFANFPNIK